MQIFKIVFQVNTGNLSISKFIKLIQSREFPEIKKLYSLWKKNRQDIRKGINENIDTYTDRLKEIRDETISTHYLDIDESTNLLDFKEGKEYIYKHEQILFQPNCPRSWSASKVKLNITRVKLRSMEFINKINLIFLDFKLIWKKLNFQAKIRLKKCKNS